MTYIDWDKLKAFHQVALTKSFSQASRNLSVSQPSISRQIQALEENLDTKLFVRSRQALLTYEGAILLEVVEEFLQNIKVAQESIEANKSIVQGALRVVASTGLATSYLYQYIPDFIKQYPKINLSLTAKDDIIESDLWENDILISPKINNLNDSFVQVALKSFKTGLYASKSYLKTFGHPKSLKDLDNHSLIAHTVKKNKKLSELNWFLSVERPFKSPRKPSVSINFATGRCFAAKAGLGIISLPENHPELEGGDFEEVLKDFDKPSIDMYIIYLKEFEQSKRIRAFVDYIKTQVLSLPVSLRKK